MFKRFRKWMIRRTRARTDAEYALLFHRVSRRLGIARSRARQAEQDLVFWRERTQANAMDLIETKKELDKVQAELKQYKRAVQRRLEEAADQPQKYNIPINTRPGV